MDLKFNLPKGQFALDLDDMERALADKGYQAICGVDEVGRGPLAGPVVAAAVILPIDLELEGLNDSKKLSPKRREMLFEQIAQAEIPCAVGVIDHQDIDRINILQASLAAMRKAVMELNPRADFVLVDGKFTVPNISQPQFALVGGDGRCRAIAAASIVAKVTRDRIMVRLEELYPQFSFSRHKGYPTPAHLEELREHGPCEIHRRSFRPVAEALEQYALL
jgi:ribonuclease HII